MSNFLFHRVKHGTCKTCISFISGPNLAGWRTHIAFETPLRNLPEDISDLFTASSWSAAVHQDDSLYYRNYTLRRTFVNGLSSLLTLNSRYLGRECHMIYCLQGWWEGMLRGQKERTRAPTRVWRDTDAIQYLGNCHLQSGVVEGGWWDGHETMENISLYSPIKQVRSLSSPNLYVS